MMQKNLKIWRESASLILVAKNVFGRSELDAFNYKVLCLKRSSKSEFMPSTYVFPGGNYSKNDGDPNWLKLFKKFNFSKQSLNGLQSEQNVPQILIDKEKDVIPRYISFRICAIRETFEECGLLLCKSPKTKQDNSEWASFIGNYELIEWQQKIQEDPKEFINMCTHFEIFPDIWALKNWSNWITPPALPLKFNTIFFLASLNQIPPVYPDKKEVQSLMWTCPEHCLTQNINEKVMLPIPQFYELSRLKNFVELDALSKFAAERSKFGFEMYWPSRINTTKGLYSILPGDDLYPETIDPNDSTVPFMDQLPKSTIKNRVFIKNEYVNHLEVENFTPGCNHIAPCKTEK